MQLNPTIWLFSSLLLPQHLLLLSFSLIFRFLLFVASSPTYSPRRKKKWFSNCPPPLSFHQNHHQGRLVLAATLNQPPPPSSASHSSTTPTTVVVTTSLRTMVSKDGATTILCNHPPRNPNIATIYSNHRHTTSFPGLSDSSTLSV